MNSFLKGKRVLVTGGTGLIGIPLVHHLKDIGTEVRVLSLDDRSPFDDSIDFVRGDICDSTVCERAVQDTQVVFHLAGLKGGIGVAQKKASTFLVDNTLMNINIMEAARKSQVERFLYTSSICIYPPARVFEEENAFSGFPHPSDKFGGMAKLIGEMQIEAYKLQYNLENFLIARPANTYGPHDNFNPVSALIIPALIYRVFCGENPLTVWGDGSVVRDFVYASDVADFMIQMVEQNVNTPLNVGSGNFVDIKSIAETVIKHAENTLNRKIDIKWDTTKPTGEKYRVTSIKKSQALLGWSPKVSLDEGIKNTVAWYSKNRTKQIKRHDIMTEGKG